MEKRRALIETSALRMSSSAHRLVLPPITLDDAVRALADAWTVDDLVRVSNAAEALRRYAERARLGLAAQNRAATIRFEAERKIGEYLLRTQRHRGGRPKRVPGGTGFDEPYLSPAKLRELGIDRKLSMQSQKLVAIPETDFRWYLDHATENGWEISHSLLIYHCYRQNARRERERPAVGGKIDDLVAFSRSHRMRCIYIDIPWFVAGSIMPYPTMTIDEIRALPIPELADPTRCHLHVWCLPNETHRIVYDLIEFWGFRPVGEFVWCKKGSPGQGLYWRHCHETLITATNTTSKDGFDDRRLPSYGEFPRGRHSEKPDEVRAMLERASAGPYLELFARKQVPGWYSWGFDIASPLVSQMASRQASLLRDRTMLSTLEAVS
jgi:N6-adenosine-specific RNA methylase IME4